MDYIVVSWLGRAGAGLCIGVGWDASCSIDAEGKIASLCGCGPDNSKKKYGVSWSQRGKSISWKLQQPASQLASERSDLFVWLVIDRCYVVTISSFGSSVSSWPVFAFVTALWLRFTSPPPSPSHLFSSLFYFPSFCPYFPGSPFCPLLLLLLLLPLLLPPPPPS